jgi:amino acid transporter
MKFKSWGDLFLGKSVNPLSPDSRKSVALIAFMAWIGLGADGLSSSCYGPALGFQALGHFQHLALYLAALTAITVFLIAISYNQVIELFPNGGGGYKVANTLLGPAAGITSGAALIIDYLLTIAISVASAVEAISSTLPETWHIHKMFVEICVVAVLIYINLRGSKESIKVLLPIFLGFFLTHVAIILYGIIAHGAQFPDMVHQTVRESKEAGEKFGVIALLAILLRAYSHGSGTYTGLEAVSNNVNMLAEPRVKTGKLTMIYMACSLSFVAGGIILLYLLWHVKQISGQTLNASVFAEILGPSTFGHIGLMILMLFEMGLLVVGANTGFLGGPAVLANMSLDNWVPSSFSALSTRLVKQNGILFFGVFAAIVLVMTQGNVSDMVILYSVNVFITFSVSLFGLVVYWWKKREEKGKWVRPFCLSFVATIVCVLILVITVCTNFFPSGILSLLLTALVVAIGYVCRRAYQRHNELKRNLDKSLEVKLGDREEVEIISDPSAPTAVFLVNRLGAAMHTILWVERLFPNHFKNYVFLSYGMVDTGTFGSTKALEILQTQTSRVLKYLTYFSTQRGIATVVREEFGTQPIEDIVIMAEKINKEFTNTVYFAARYIYPDENIFTRMMHSDFSLMVQRKLQNVGVKMLIVPLDLAI